MQRFSDLRVWKAAHAFALATYQASRTFPKKEQYTLTSQLRRAALSIPTNIAEGSKRQTATDYARFLNMAEGSAAECEYLLGFSRDLGLLAPANAQTLIDEVGSIARMLFRLRKTVESNMRRAVERSVSETGS